MYAPYEKPAKFNGEPIAIAIDGPAAVNQKIRCVKTSVEGKYLSVELKASADLRVTIDRQPFLLRMDRHATYYWVPSSDG